MIHKDIMVSETKILVQVKMKEKNFSLAFLVQFEYMKDMQNI